jgi:ribosomal silencing factor RsfS
MQPATRSYYALEELWQAKPKRTARTAKADDAESGIAAG